MTTGSNRIQNVLLRKRVFDLREFQGWKDTTKNQRLILAWNQWNDSFKQSPLLWRLSLSLPLEAPINIHISPICFAAPTWTRCSSSWRARYRAFASRLSTDPQVCWSWWRPPEPATTGGSTVGIRIIWYSGTILTTFDPAEGVKAKIYFKAVANEAVDGRTYLTTDSVKMDFNVKEIQMGVDNIANGNSVIRKFKAQLLAINLY